MALIKCKDCKKEISTDVKICPNCGAREKKSAIEKIIGFITLFVTALIIFVILYRFVVLYNTPSSNQVHIQNQKNIRILN